MKIAWGKHFQGWLKFWYGPSSLLWVDYYGISSWLETKNNSLFVSNWSGNRLDKPITNEANLSHSRLGVSVILSWRRCTKVNYTLHQTKTLVIEVPSEYTHAYIRDMHRSPKCWVVAVYNWLAEKPDWIFMETLNQKDVLERKVIIIFKTGGAFISFIIHCSHYARDLWLARQNC